MPTVSLLLYAFLFKKNDVNLPWSRTKIAGSGSDPLVRGRDPRAGSVRYQNVADPEHCYQFLSVLVAAQCAFCI
jgi:hypothetical protein